MTFYSITKYALLVFLLVLLNSVSWAQTVSITYIHTDHLGTPVMATNEDGSMIWKKDYQPFGQVAESTESVSEENTNTGTSVDYTGHLIDKDNGLIYMKGRWYHPEAGRFMALDPIIYRDVHSFNRYVYANNNPYKYVDPDGRSPELLYITDQQAYLEIRGDQLSVNSTTKTGLNTILKQDQREAFMEIAGAIIARGLGKVIGNVTTRILNKGDRIKMIVEDIGKINAKNADDALKQVNRIVDRVEDAHSGVKKVANPGKAFDGRMYGPRSDSVTRHSDGSVTAKINKGTLQISADGKVTLSR